jgi:hypothetical protein
MSFFKDLAAEVQKEFDNATAEFKGDWLKSVPGLNTKPATPSPLQQGGSASQQVDVRYHTPNPGVIEHHVSSPTNRSSQPEQRPPQQKKRGKKPPQQQTSTAAQPRVKKVSSISAHKLVANLTPAVARSSIIMAEVLGPPVSKRQRRGNVR